MAIETLFFISNAIFIFASFLVAIFPKLIEEYRKWLGYGCALAGTLFMVSGWFVLRSQHISTEKMISEIHGGDDVYFEVLPAASDQNKYEIVAMNPTRLPIYDIIANIKRIDGIGSDDSAKRDAALKEILNPRVLRVNNLSGVAAHLGEFLPPGKYQFDILTRFGSLQETIQFGPFNNGFGISFAVRGRKNNFELKATSPENYPKVY